MTTVPTKIMMPPPAAIASSLDRAVVPPPPIVHTLLREQHPVVVDKDKSIHSEHGVIHYPFYFGGVASATANICTQPFGVGKRKRSMYELRNADEPHSGLPTSDSNPCRCAAGHDQDIFLCLEARRHTRPLERSTNGQRRSAQEKPLTHLQLTASLTRTVTYATVRFGMYEELKDSATTSTHAPSAIALALMAAGSGATGSVVGNFADIVALRMQHDESLPLEQRRNYRNIWHGLTTMIKTEGWSSIWTGVGVGATRAALATAAQLAGYDIFKRELMAGTEMTDSIPLHISASCLAGFLSTVICSPFDVFKARLMTNKTQNRAMWTMISRMIKNEGIGFMFKGLLPAMISRGPSTIVTFVAFEQLKRLYRVRNKLEE